MGGVWNTEFDTFWFAAVGIQTTEPNLTNGTLAARWLLGGGPGVSSWFKQHIVCYLNLKTASFEELNIKDIVFYGHLTENYHALQIIRKDEVFHGLLLYLFWRPLAYKNSIFLHVMQSFDMYS